jgi:hypothetical protein
MESHNVPIHNTKLWYFFSGIILLVCKVFLGEDKKPRNLRRTWLQFPAAPLTAFNHYRADLGVVWIRLELHGAGQYQSQSETR